MQAAKYTSTCRLRALQKLKNGTLEAYGEYGLLFVRFAALTMIWRSLAAQGADLGGFTLEQLLTYTLLTSAFPHQFSVVTPATTALWEGSILNRYTRPVPVMRNFAAETFGTWLPELLLFSLPLMLISPLFGVNPLPVSLLYGILFVVSFALSISLGFAIDFIFAAFALKLKNGCWIAMSIRESVFTLLSGGLIPLSLFPFGIGTVLSWLPFGSIAFAPLTLFLGTGKPQVILIQLFWNLVLWPIAIWYFNRNQENLVPFGG